MANFCPTRCVFAGAGGRARRARAPLRRAGAPRPCSSRGIGIAGDSSVLLSGSHTATRGPHLGLRVIDALEHPPESRSQSYSTPGSQAVLSKALAVTTKACLGLVPVGQGLGLVSVGDALPQEWVIDTGEEGQGGRVALVADSAGAVHRLEAWLQGTRLSTTLDT